MNGKIERLKKKFLDVSDGLDELQEEILARGMELRPGLRRQFEEALRGLFYAMTVADGEVDEREVQFYNYLFDENLSVTTFELVRRQMKRASDFEHDLLSAVATFAQYDKQITGDLPLNAPSLTALLLSAAETTGRMVIESDGQVDDDEVKALRGLIQACKDRANLVISGAEEILADGAMGESYDPDALLSRDVRGVQREVCSVLTELLFQGADVVVSSRIGQSSDETKTAAEAVAFIAGSIRDDLERGNATTDLMVLAGTQIGPIVACLRTVKDAGDDVEPGWRELAELVLQSNASKIRDLKETTALRVRVIREKHQWAGEVDALESGLASTWEAIEGG